MKIPTISDQEDTTRPHLSYLMHLSSDDAPFQSLDSISYSGSIWLENGHLVVAEGKTLSLVDEIIQN
jgi:hypothetical protein